MNKANENVVTIEKKLSKIRKGRTICTRNRKDERVRTMNRALLILFFVMIGITLLISVEMRDSASLNSLLDKNLILQNSHN